MRYVISLGHRGHQLFCVATALLLMCGLMLPADPARAESVDYATVGAWSVTYNETSDGNFCNAIEVFDDKTLIQFALFQTSSDITWLITVGNPGWTNTIRSRN